MKKWKIKIYERKIREKESKRKKEEKGLKELTTILEMVNADDILQLEAWWWYGRSSSTDRTKGAVVTLIGGQLLQGSAQEARETGMALFLRHLNSLKHSGIGRFQSTTHGILAKSFVLEVLLVRDWGLRSVVRLDARLRK